MNTIEPFLSNRPFDQRRKEILRVLFLEHLMANGLDDKAIKNVLEISTKVEESISILLSQDSYNPFLVSPDITPYFLEKHKLNGIEGCIYNGEIYQGGWGNDIEETDKLSHGPKVECFDIAIAMGISNLNRCAMYSLRGIEKIWGECVFYNNLKTKKYYDTLYREVLETMYEESNEQNVLITKVNERENIGYYLIKNK